MFGRNAEKITRVIGRIKTPRTKKRDSLSKGEYMKEEERKKTDNCPDCGHRPFNDGTNCVAGGVHEWYNADFPKELIRRD